MKTNKNLSDLDKNFIIILSVLLVFLVGLFAAAFLLPPNIPSPVMPEGTVQIYASRDGSLDVYWPELPVGYTCRVDVKDTAVVMEEDHASMSPKSYSEPVQIRFSAVAEGKNLLGATRRRESQNYLEISLDLTDSQLLQSPRLTGQSQAEGTLELDWDGIDGVQYEVCLVQQNRCTPLRSLTAKTVTLRFGRDGDLEMPDGNQQVDFAVRRVEEKEGYTFYGPLSETVQLGRTNLLSDKLSVRYDETDERMYTLHWSETPGDYYEVQQWSRQASRWDTVGRVDAGGELSYETGRLGSGIDCRYRVTAYGQASSAATPKISAGPEEISFRTSFSPLYASIWPILDQPLYSDVNQSEILDTIPGGTMLCVLGEENGYFSVHYQSYNGYVDSRFCMIDLPEYVGDLCEYNITNSYSSVFKVHDYSIEQITGQVIKGFENVRMASGDYLVPFLYPSAKKLITAAEAAEKDGYHLKIYEAYRPNEATHFLYNTTLAQLDNPVTGQNQAQNQGQQTASAARSRARMMPEPEPEPVPEPEPEAPPMEALEDEGESLMPSEAAGGDTVTEPSEPAAPVEPEPAPEPEPIPVEPTPEPDPTPAEPEPEPAPVPEPESAPVPEPKPKPEVLTLGKVMTDGRFRIGAFLAASVSNHNRGIALDLTLESLADGTELEMQSAIHDLSWYAATYRNNENAKLLEHYMKETAGMAGLTSEWWHFQDDEIKEELNLTGYLDKGVSPEGWKRDDAGWRYRKADGSFYISTTMTANKIRYTFDKDGYLQSTDYTVDKNRNIID